MLTQSLIRSGLLAGFMTLVACAGGETQKSTDGYMNEPAGYGGLKWGERIAGHADFVAGPQLNPKMHAYLRKGPAASFGGIRPSGVIYAVRDGVLSDVMLFVMPYAEETRQAMQAVLERKYGHPVDRRPDRLALLWRGRQTHILFSCKQAKNICTIHFRDARLGR